MSMEDESVLQYYNDTVKLVKVNDESYLEFPLPWAHDPGAIENNFTQANDALLGLRRKLINKPEIRSQYCRKIDDAIREGHFLPIPDGQLRKDLEDKTKLQ